MNTDEWDFECEGGELPPTPLCLHSWIDPSDPPIARAPYSPVIGDKRREMKPGMTYRCNNCQAILRVMP